MDEATRRRYAITVVGELPSDQDDALAVLDLAREIILWRGGKPGNDKPAAVLRLIPRGSDDPAA